MSGTGESVTVVHKSPDPFSVYIGRPSPWGNPFVLGRHGDRETVIAKYREWVLTADDPRAEWIREHVSDLRGQTLGCFCAPFACHGDVLAQLAECEPVTTLEGERYCNVHGWECGPTVGAFGGPSDG